MSTLDNPIDTVLRGTSKLISTESLMVDAVQDLVRDEIKRYIRAKLEENPELKQEMKDAVGELMEAKIKEAYALIKITKCGAKLGLELVPPHIREEMTGEFVKMFEKEISRILERTM